MALGVGLYRQARVLFDATAPSLGLAAAVHAPCSASTLAEARAAAPRAAPRRSRRQREAAARLAGELEAARRIQMGILPSPAAAAPATTRFDLYAFLEPAREVGGDLYDFFRLDGDRMFFLVGDVSGKGLPGSLFMAVSKSLCKSIALRRGRRPRRDDARGEPRDLAGQRRGPVRHRVGRDPRRADGRARVLQRRPRAP